jgi:hypothetical protein
MGKRIVCENEQSLWGIRGHIRVTYCVVLGGGCFGGKRVGVGEREDIRIKG